MKRIVSVSLPDWPIERHLRERSRNAPSPPLPSGLAAAPEAPFALVETGHRGIRLSAVNRAARTAGIEAGAALADARAIWPALAAAPADPAADREGIRRLARWMGRYGIARNAYGLGVESSSGHRIRCYGLWVDIAGVAHLYGGEAGLLADLEARLAGFGLTAQAALADTLGAAHALAWYGAGRAIAQPGATRETIAQLPLAALRLDRGRVQLLHRLGFKTIGSLAGVPRPALERRFRSRVEGEHVLKRLDQALGLRAEPRRPLIEPPVLSVRQPFAEPLISGAAIESETKVLVEAFCARLDAAGLGVRALALMLYRSDGTVAQVPLALARPVQAPGHLFGLLAERLGNVDLGFGVDLLALEAVRADPLEAAQVTLSSAQGEATAGRSARLIDRLVNRLGEARVTRIAARASHIPELRTRRISALASVPAPGPVPVVPSARRPALLLAPPEPVAVMAQVPEGAPVRFTWRRVSHRVVRASGPERIEPEWWRDLATPSKARERVRDYYVLEDATGAQFWVFRAGRYGEETASDAPPSWFIHGVLA